MLLLGFFVVVSFGQWGVRPIENLISRPWHQKQDTEPSKN